MTIPEKLQQTSDQLGTESGVLSIPFIYKEDIKLKQRNVVVTQLLLSGSNSLILGHPVNGKLGVATGMGGGQIVLGSSGSNVTIELMRRAYEFKEVADFERGNIQNVDISQGFIQLGNVTVKNILLEHSSK